MTISLKYFAADKDAQLRAGWSVVTGPALEGRIHEGPNTSDATLREYVEMDLCRSNFTLQVVR
jgi:hypothetical protein